MQLLIAASLLWHIIAYTPNLFDRDGVACQQSWPAHKAVCPPLCTKIRDDDNVLLTAEALSEKCGINCLPPKVLLQDGICASNDEVCPSSTDQLIRDKSTGMWSCVNDGHTTKGFTNPCACADTDMGLRFQACVNVTEVEIPHYNIAEDSLPPGGLTMQACSKSDSYRVVTGAPKESVEIGYVMCPQEGMDSFKPTHFHTSFLVGFYGIPLLVIGGFGIYKFTRESKYDSSLLTFHSLAEDMFSQDTVVPMGVPVDENKMDIQRRPTGLGENPHCHTEQNVLGVPKAKFSVSYGCIKQEGFRTSRVGRTAFGALIAVAAATLALILVQIMDVYGLLGSVFCPESTDSCLASGEETFNWREGFKCSAHCLFGDEWSTGQSRFWPYAKGARGGKVYLLIFLLVWLFAVEFFVLLRLFRSVIRSWFLLRCPLQQAKLIRVTNPSRARSIADFNTGSRAYKLVEFKSRLTRKFFGNPQEHKMCTVHPASGAAPGKANMRHFVYNSERFLWNPSAYRFQRVHIQCGKTTSDLITQLDGLTSTEAANRIELLGPNQVEVKMPSLIRSIFDEVFTISFIYQLMCLVIWFEFYYWLAASIVLVVIVVSICLTIYSKRNSRNRLVTLAMRQTSLVCRRDGRFTEITNDQVTIGDVVLLQRDLEVPCDMVLVTGNVILDESCLTGEPDPISKVPVESSQRALDVKGYDKKSILFAGSRVVGDTANLDVPALGLVIAVSTSTLRGSLLKDLLSPTQLLFEFNNHWSVVFVILFLWGLLNMVLGVALMGWELEGWYYGIFTVSQTISPLIPAVFVAGQSMAAKNLRNRKIHCVNFQRTLVAAKIKHVCLDKTGTMTAPGLSLSSISPYDIEAHLLTGPVFDAAACNDQIRWALATCHELQLSPAGDVVGVEVDLRMFNWTGSRLRLSPDSSLAVSSPSGETRKIVKRFAFQRSSMSASVIVSDESQNHFVYTKGAWESVSEMCVLPPNRETHSEAKRFAAQGYYVLAMAMKSFQGHADTCHRDEVETGLQLLGLIAFKNELVYDTEETLRLLKAADINAVMITGDSVLTAIKTARDCALFDPDKVVMTIETDVHGALCWKLADDEANNGLYPLQRSLTECTQLAITGAAFELLKLSPEMDLENIVLKKTKVFARMSPQQKVDVVKRFMQDGITTMVGDGANDAPALEVAHVGVAMRSGSTTGSREATVVAHFSCSDADPTLKPILTLIQYGRCALAATTAAYKNLIIYGQITVMVSLLEMWLHIVPAEAYWITVDAVVNSLMTYAILSSKPAPTLAPKLPTSSLFSLSVAWSIVGQVVSNWLWMVGVMLLLLFAPFAQCRQFDPRTMDHAQWWKKSDNFEAATLGIFALFQWFTTGPVVSFGNGFRQKWIKAYKVHLLWAIFMTLLLGILFTTATNLSCMFRTNCGDASLLNFWYEHKLHGGIVRRRVPIEGTRFIPPGCPCETQLQEGANSCELEVHEPCDARHYHSAFHHNILPHEWRLTLLGLMGANLLCNYAAEILVLRKDNSRFRNRM